MLGERRHDYGMAATHSLDHFICVASRASLARPNATLTLWCTWLPLQEPKRQAQQHWDPARTYPPCPPAP